MKVKFTLLLLAVICFSKTNAQYNKALADSLGADEYGMKMYYFVILKTGKADVKDDATKTILFRGHMDNITRLSKEGKLIVAGLCRKIPITTEGSLSFPPNQKKKWKNT